MRVFSNIVNVVAFVMHGNECSAAVLLLNHTKSNGRLQQRNLRIRQSFNINQFVDSTSKHPLYSSLRK